ncbi:ferritin-like fold-containing protein [Janibacter terrae]|uniref:ferritin-like fold-containing protein n=1 Tax=Janibacter TaxID=53457 RepID=UPI0009ED1565|nr:ferritin-like fold-containing protein [Janibacter terrae]
MSEPVLPSSSAAPSHREGAGTIDLLGVIAYGAISGFTRIAADSEMADDLALKRALAGIAVKEFRNHELLSDHIVALGGDPIAAMEPFREAFDAYHERTRPRDLLEGLVKAYIGDGIASDFFLEVARYVDPTSRAIVEQAGGSHRDVDVIVSAVRRGIAQDPRRGGPLALWGRRLVGEALTQGQVVAAQHESLSDLVLGLGPDRPGASLEEVGRLMQRLTDRHQLRMGRLGLAS